MTAWTKELIMEKTDLLVPDGKEAYIQRRNFKKIKATEDTPEHYECEMRFITVAEYEMLKAMQNIVAGNEEV